MKVGFAESFPVLEKLPISARFPEPPTSESKTVRLLKHIIFSPQIDW